MSSSRGAAAKAAASQYGQLAKEAYGLGVPATSARFDALMPAIRQGQLGKLPTYLENAFEVQRTGLQEGFGARERQALGAQDLAAKGTVSGGNISSTLNPAQMGALLADAMMGSRVQQGMATIGQTNNLMQMAMGGVGQAGNAAVGAAGQSLQAMSMMPNYNPTYAAILGGVNAAGTLYGAGKQAGWWGSPQAQPPGQPPPNLTTTWMGGNPIA